MKHVKLIAWVCLLTCWNTTVKSEHTNLHTSDVNVAGLSIGSRYTAAQIEEAMGCKPIRNLQWQDEFGLAEEYEYSSAILRFRENGVLVEFSISTSLYPVFEQYQCGIRVGNSIKHVAKMNFQGWSLKTQSNEEYRYVKNRERLKFEVNESGRITRISYRFALFD